MAEVEFRFPSNKAYAYVGVKGTAEELGLESLEPGYLARAYADKLLIFLAEEKAALTKTVPTPPKVDQSVEDTLADELGAQKISETEKKPWESKPTASVAADDKPWNRGVTVSDDDDWDI